MYIHQKNLELLEQKISPDKVVIIYGARRLGKTTLLKKFIEGKKSVLFVSGEDITVQSFLSSQSILKLKEFVGKHTLLVIDEAQKIENIGVNLKLIVDHIEGIQVIATGSSSFDLAKNIGEPLTGRKHILRMFPLSQLELSSIESRHETEALLESRLIYGSYPEVILMGDMKEKEAYLREIVSSYLYKDILELDGIRHSNKISRLLQLLAFQIGKEVSLNELGTQLGMSKNTVDKYLDLLEKSFVIFNLRGFSRNLRKEVSKNSRYFFYDTGIRNALIGNFNIFPMRNDVGMLWENYLIVERLKRQEYLQEYANNYFWRTYDRKEIDFIEERGGFLYGYEMKWKEGNVKPPKDWLTAYDNASFTTINRDNYFSFIT